MVNTRKCQKKTENDEMLEKIKVVVAVETEKIENSNKRKFDEIAGKLQSIEESVSKISKLDEKSKSSKKFVLKHVFENVANLKEGDCVHSGKEDHSNAKWYMRMKRFESHLGFHVFCEPIAPVSDKWSIDTKLEFRMMGNDSVIRTMKRCFDDNRGWGSRSFLTWENIENYAKLAAKVKVEILKKTGFNNEKSRLFDESQEDVSDVVLVVKDTKLYVQKMYLALHSSYFKALFLGKFAESQKSEIELKDIDPDDFQNFLELIHGESSIDDNIVEGILHLADIYDAPTAMRRCEAFLLNDSKKEFKKKLQISTQYLLEKLKTQCLSKINKIDDVRELLPDDLSDLDRSTAIEILQKCASSQ